MCMEVGIMIGLGLGLWLWLWLLLWLGLKLGLETVFVGEIVVPYPSSISTKNPHPWHICCGTKTSTVCVICRNLLS